MNDSQIKPYNLSLDMFALYAYIASMKKTLGQEILRYRQKAELTLRAMAKKAKISPAHQSDIEHGRRLPSDDLLKRIAEILGNVGATYEDFKKLDTRIDPELSDWISKHPEASQMLREIRASKESPKEVLERLKEILKAEEKKRKNES
jgi:transcriptional regulator with XRE-family HTH domain